MGWMEMNYDFRLGIERRLSVACIIEGLALRGDGYPPDGFKRHRLWICCRFSTGCSVGTRTYSLQDLRTALAGW